MVRFSRFTLLMISLVWIASSTQSWAAPSVADALELMPVQENVSFDTPTKQEIEKCTIKPEKINKTTAWIVRGPNGDILRRFADSNGDNVVDTWSYFQNGIEVYRDIDSDASNKADQYRWFHGAGSRWGIDENEDGSIDRWKLISAEELAEETIEALRTGDGQRFGLLVLSKEDLKGLGLGKAQAEQISKRTAAAAATFKKLLSAGSIKEDSEFSDFGGLKPGMVPAGTQGSTKDLLVYEGVSAMVRVGDDHQQLQLGTLINIQGAWKLIDGPTLGNSQELAAAEGIFYNRSLTPINEEPLAAAPDTGPSEKMQEALTELENLDRQIATAPPGKSSDLNLKRANLLLQLANLEESKAGKEQWLMQMADMVSASAQDGSFPKGIDYLKQMQEKLAPRVKSKEISKNVLAHFKFSHMLAHYYGVVMADPKVDYVKANEKWLKDLEAFVKEFPKSENAAEAMRQLAMGSEMSGDAKAAVNWYRRITKEHPKSAAAPMAKGAVVRLTSDGKIITLYGTAVGGGKFDLSKQRGKAVVIQYWATTSDVCKADHAVLKSLYSKYGGKRLEIVGVNLDFQQQQMIEYLKANKLPWKQLYEDGGFDSRLASEMGVVTVPMMVLVDPQGKVVSTTLQAAELETELKKILK